MSDATDGFSAIISAFPILNTAIPIRHTEPPASRATFQAPQIAQIALDVKAPFPRRRSFQLETSGCQWRCACFNEHTKISMSGLDSWRQFAGQQQTRRAFLGRSLGSIALASLLNPRLL